MMRLQWFPDAKQDLNRIYDFYFKKSPRAAAKLYNSILDEALLLENHPYIAAIDPVFEDFAETIRSLVVVKGRFKVTYYVENDIIYVIIVWSCRQNPERLKKYLKRRLK